MATCALGLQRASVMLRMRRPSRPASFLCALLAAGCSLSHPQTAAEFRHAVPGAQTAARDTFEVDRPLAQVGASFQRLASECLDRSIRTTEHQPHVSYQVVTTSYKPTVQVSATSAELHVQQRHRGNVINVGKEPDGGYYLLVADAHPVSVTRTCIVPRSGMRR